MSQIRWLLAALALVLTLLVYFVVDRYRQAEVAAASKTLNLVQLIEAHVVNDLARIDGVLDYIAKTVGQPGQQQRLADLQASFTMLAALNVFDAQGMLLDSSDPNVKGISIADRPHFQRLRDDPKLHLVFSEAQIARTTGQWSVVQARVLRDADGRFLGTASALIVLDNFSKLFGSVDIGADGGILLRNSETFKLMQRIPRNNENDFNQPLPKNNATRQRIEAGERLGTLSFTASTDGVERLASFKVMDDYPFYVQVALSKTEVLADWRRDAAAVAGLAVLLLAAFAFAVRRLQNSAAIAQAATRQLVYRQALFAGLFEQSSFLAGILDHAGHLLEVNQAALAVIGLRRDEVVGQYFADTAWWSRAENRAALQATLQTAALGTPGSFEMVHTSVSGAETTVLFHALPVLAGDERYIAVTGVDITARKVAEEAVRELLSRLQRLAAHLPGFLYQYRVMPDGRSDFPYAGPGIEAIYGMSPEEVTQDASRVFAVLHPDDLARIGASIQRSADTLTLWHESYRVQHRDGRLLWVEGHATPIRQADGSTLWHGYIHDVSERQHAEQAARDSEVFSQNVLDSVQSQIAVIDQTGTILTVNEAWRRFSRENSPNPGQPTPATEVGTNYLKVCKSGGDEALEAWTGILGVLERRLPSFYLEFPCPSPMGQFWFAMSVGPLSVGIKGAVIVHSDITARKQTEHDLQQQTEALARSNAELEQFAFVASHDLRQPLRMVNSYVQMLERRLAEQLDEDTRKMMHFATEGAERMDQMLVSLLEYSRVGRKGEPMAPLDSRAAVDEAMHFLAPAIAQTQATVRVSGDWPQVVASRDEFTRLWQNLIGNAVKYRAPERAPEIDITATPQADGCWHFCVADSGIGIDPVQFDRLFKVFQRLHTREQYEGNGIGLAVARKIVERHGGRIWAESGGAGLGCRFCFTLPAHRPGTGVAP